jgi:hypothetical protein
MDTLKKTNYIFLVNNVKNGYAGITTALNYILENEVNVKYLFQNQPIPDYNGWCVLHEETNLNVLNEVKNDKTKIIGQCRKENFKDDLETPAIRMNKKTSPYILKSDKYQWNVIKTDYFHTLNHKEYPEVTVLTFNETIIPNISNNKLEKDYRYVNHAPLRSIIDYILPEEKTETSLETLYEEACFFRSKLENQGEDISQFKFDSTSKLNELEFNLWVMKKFEKKLKLDKYQL